MAMMCKGCGTMKAYMDGVCKGCHSLRDSNLFKEDEGVKKAEASSSESASETTSEHGEQEVRMSLQQLHSVCEAATSLKAHVKKETLVPAWVQSLLTVAHENLEHIEGYFEGKHMKKGMQPAVGAMAPANPKMQAGGVRKIANKPVKPGTSGHAGSALIHRSEAEMGNDTKKGAGKVSKSELPTFPRVTGDSRVLLQHVTPNQTVIQQITDRDTHQPHSYGLTAANFDEAVGLRRR